jgi:hypothetical protein
VHPLPAAIGCQEVHVACGEARLPDRLEGWAGRSEFEALSTGVRGARDVRLELQHQGAMVARYLAHTRLTALLQHIEEGGLSCGVVDDTSLPGWWRGAGGLSAACLGYSAAGLVAVVSVVPAGWHPAPVCSPLRPAEHLHQASGR